MGMVRCKWTICDEDYGVDYDTECGKSYPCRKAESLEDVGFIFCPFCGKEIKVVK